MAAVAEADFRQPEDSAIMSCRVRAGTTIGSGTCVVNCDVGKDVRIGDNCALYGVTLTAGSKVASNTFMYTPSRAQRRKERVRHHYFKR